MMRAEDNLREIFNEAGDVRETTIITNKTTGQSRGFVFVTMADEAGAKSLRERSTIATLGRQLTVNIARPRLERLPGNFKPSRRQF